MQIHYHEDGEILNLQRFLVLLNFALNVVIQFDSSACLLTFVNTAEKNTAERRTT